MGQDKFKINCPVVTKYRIRCWDTNVNVEVVKLVTLTDIVNGAQDMHMNLADIGLVLLNLKRAERKDLLPFEASSITDNDGTYGIPVEFKVL